jgi:hypothetical protein
LHPLESAAFARHTPAADDHSIRGPPGLAADAGRAPLTQLI